MSFVARSRIACVVLCDGINRISSKLRENRQTNSLFVSPWKFKILDMNFLQGWQRCISFEIKYQPRHFNWGAWSNIRITNLYGKVDVKRNKVVNETCLLDISINFQSSVPFSISFLQLIEKFYKT